LSHPDAELFWSGRYRDVGDDYLFGTAPNRFLQRQQSRLIPGARALAIADGEGRNSVWLAEQGIRVTATEISPVALHKARRLAVQRQVEVEFVLADVLKWQWPVGDYDLVVAVFIQFLAPEERRQVFLAMQRALRPGGLLLVHGYTPKQLEFRTGGPSAEANLYTREMLVEAFANMEILELRDYEDFIEEGIGHKGHSALIDLVARQPG
jgi:SAM-dependent methyltransferase